MQVRGVSFIGSGALTPSVSASLGYTYTSPQQNELAGGYAAIVGIPENQVERSLDVHPSSVPFGPWSP